jgi:hypothetical protein
MRTLLLLSLAACAGAPCPAMVTTAVATTTPAITRTGDLRDFDTFAGGWMFKNRRLKARGVGSTDWDEFPAVSCTRLYIDGVSNVDEIYFPTKGWSGLTVRTFDAAKRQWSIYWVNSREGVLYPPVVGGFDGDHGEFYGDDKDDGKPVKVVFKWTKFSPDHLKWEQSFSYDGGKTWEMNWTNELTRGDENAICDRGRPRR